MGSFGERTPIIAINTAANKQSKHDSNDGYATTYDGTNTNWHTVYKKTTSDMMTAEIFFTHQHHTLN